MVQVGFKTDQGKRRSRNEDALFVMPAENIYIVADGVGGHNAGSLASSTAVETIKGYIEKNPLNKVAEKKLPDYFLDCIKTANKQVITTAGLSAENTGMATTVLLLYLAGGRAYLSNVGDSRAYLFRQGQLEQITEDHTYVNELVKEGTITRAEADVHPQRNMITRALGGEKRVTPDFYSIEAKAGDVFILCTDGLYGEVPKEDICKMASAADSMEDLTADYISAANENGGHDNITVICVKIQED